MKIEYAFCIAMWTILLIISILLLIFYVALGSPQGLPFTSPSVPMSALNLEAILILFSWGSTIISLIILVSKLSHSEDEDESSEELTE